ncbi:MAG TPA: ADP-glyceromanno-heptose 6-epimerase, partial [Ramlibacter sp.]|nr:ADP-glyceromanno-heptose 6-epimerase [Ramlibacter sp.]
MPGALRCPAGKETVHVVVTGAAGFIGSNIVRALNARGITEILAVDDLSSGDKARNLVGLRIADYVDKGEFYDRFALGSFGRVEAVLHDGACTDTSAVAASEVMRDNYSLSCRLLDACHLHDARLIYASAAAVYGNEPGADPGHEQPLDLYGYSKLLFDGRVRRECGPSFTRNGAQVVGLRYFSVYGPGESHKGRMRSIVSNAIEQCAAGERVTLWAPETGAPAPTRDLVHVDDVVAVNLWFLDHPARSGIFDVGTGRAIRLDQVAAVVQASVRAAASQESDASELEHV